MNLIIYVTCVFSCLVFFRASSSRASTPLSHSSLLHNGTGRRPRGRPRKHPVDDVPKKKRDKSSAPKQKKIKMVLEKDDAYEVDYISSEDCDVCEIVKVYLHVMISTII